MASQITNYKCPACTGPLHFVGASGMLECDFCGAKYDVAQIEALYAEKEAKSVEATEKANAKAEENRQKIAEMEARLKELDTLLMDAKNACDMKLVTEYTTTKEALDKENDRWMQLSEQLESL